MEATAITDAPHEADIESGDVATFCNELGDARIVRAVVALAAGKSQKEAAAAAGVDRITLWRWCKQWPIETLARAEAAARARPALLKLSANLEAAADVICQATRGEIEPEATEKGVSYARAQLQLQAAKVTVGLMAKRTEPGTDDAPAVFVQPKGRELSSAELIAAARAASKRLKGG